MGWGGAGSPSAGARGRQPTRGGGGPGRGRPRKGRGSEPAWPRRRPLGSGPEQGGSWGVSLLHVGLSCWLSPTILGRQGRAALAQSLAGSSSSSSAWCDCEGAVSPRRHKLRRGSCLGLPRPPFPPSPGKRSAAQRATARPGRGVAHSGPEMGPPAWASKRRRATRQAPRACSSPRKTCPFSPQRHEKPRSPFPLPGPVAVVRAVQSLDDKMSPPPLPPPPPRPGFLHPSDPRE